MTRQNFSLKLTGLSLGLLLLMATPFFAKAGGESHGWFAPTVDYIDESTACPYNKYALDIALAMSNSTSTYPATVGVWNLTIADAAGNTLFSDTYNGQLLSNQYCVDPFNEYSVQVTVNETSDTFGITTPTVKPNILFGPFAVDSKTPGSPSSHYRGYIHLESKSWTGSKSNISSLSPDGSFLRSTPDFLVRTNTMPTIYGPSTLKSITVNNFNISDGTQKSVTVPASGGVATRLISGMPTLTDGAYLWYYSQNFTGSTANVHSLAGDWSYVDLPSTGQTTPLSFTVDSTPPEINLITNVDTIGPVGTDKIRVNVKLDAGDTLAGLSTSTLVIKRLEISGGIPLYATSSQIITALNGQVDLLKLNFDATLDENEDYQFVHYLTDRAGNVSVSNTYNYTAPSVITLSAPVLEVRDASDIQTTQAYIPSYISSKGGSNISDRGTCWSLAASATLNLTSLPIPGVNCLGEPPSSNIGYPTGLFAFTHTGLPASTTIWYFGYAKNGTAIGVSPWSSFKTLPDGIEISPTPTLPTIGSVYSDNVTANSANAVMSIENTGGALITERALCWKLGTQLMAIPPVPGSDCFIDSTLRNTSYSLPDIFAHKFYYLPPNTNILLIGYAANSVGTTTKWSWIKTPKESLDIAQPDFSITQTYNAGLNTYDLDFSITATDLSNFFLPPTTATGIDRRVVPFTVKLSDLSGLLVDSISGTVKANNPANLAVPADIIPLQFTNVAPGSYRLKVEVNDPESVYQERAASTTAGLNNIRIKLLNLSDPSGTPTTPPIYVFPTAALYFDQKIARSETPTKLYWDTKLPLDLSCKIYGGSDFGPTAIYSFNPAVDGQTGSVELTKLKNFQTFELSCVDLVAGTGLVISTTTSISITGSYSPI